MTKMIDATVIIAAWNSESYLSESLKSAANQTGLTVSTLVVDDASTDNTEAVVRGFEGADYLRMAQNGGPAAARNAAFDHANARWLAVLDSDDTMSPTRLATLRDLAERTEADIVLGNFLRVNPDGTPRDAEDFLHRSNLTDGETITLKSYVSQNQFANDKPDTGYLKPLFRTSMLERLNLRYDETLRNSEDYHIVLRALALGAKVVVSTEPTYFYTVRSGSISHRVPPDMLEALLAADVAFLDEFDSRLDAEAKAILAKRRRSLENLVQSEMVLDCLKEGRFGAAAKGLSKNPAVLRRVLRQLMEAVRNRLSAAP